MGLQFCTYLVDHWYSSKKEIIVWCNLLKSHLKSFSLSYRWKNPSQGRKLKFPHEPIGFVNLKLLPKQNLQISHDKLLIAILWTVMLNFDASYRFNFKITIKYKLILLITKHLRKMKLRLHSLHQYC